MSKKKKFSLLPSRKKIFELQWSNLENAGTILKDFESLLDFIEGEAVPVTEKNQLFAMKLLPELNARLTSPLRISLKRPLQKSYPHINALYLLLRAAGITHIYKKGKKQFLELDETMLESWRGLSATERYFSLLEAWWCRGSNEIVGEQGYNLLFECLDFFASISKKGVSMEGKNRYERLCYYPGLHHVALMELFGFITVKSASQKTKRWGIGKIFPTAWGDALIGSFAELASLNSGWGFFDDLEREQVKLDFEKWSDLARPCFPEWNELLAEPEHKFQKGVHVLNISLDNAWRRLAVPGNFLLDALAQKILRAFDFNCDHLYRFIYKDHYGITCHVDHPYLEDSNFLTDEMEVGDLPLFPGMEMIFFFDFGDCWEFHITVEEIDSSDASTQDIKVIESYGEAPEQYPAYDWDWD